MRCVFPSPKQLISLSQLGSKGAVLAISQSWYSMAQWTRMPDSSGLFVTEQRVALLYGSFYKIFNQSRLLTALVVCDEAGAVLVDRKNATARIRRAQRLVESVMRVAPGSPVRRRHDNSFNPWPFVHDPKALVWRDGAAISAALVVHDRDLDGLGIPVDDKAVKRIGIRRKRADDADCGGRCQPTTHTKQGSHDALVGQACQFGQSG